MPEETRTSLSAGFMERGRSLLERSAHVAALAADEVFRASRVPFYVTSRLIDAEVLPALTFLSTIAQDIEESWRDTVAGKQQLTEHFAGLGRRVWSGARYDRLVHTCGKEIFGSATFAGEQTLARTDQYELSYLPPKAGGPEQEAALFHVGGFIPYGDRIFRFLPEANLFDRFLERGIPVYAMELRGPKDKLQKMRALTFDRILDTIDEFSRAAFAHRKRPLVAEAYCATAMQLLAYIAARPREADARFSKVVTFVAPIDARKCNPIAELLLHMPRLLMTTQVAAARLTRGYMRGVDMWAGLDTSLRNIFAKTFFGHFAAGWKNSSFAGVSSVADLTPAQRLELAAIYWISIDNAERFPVPADVVRLFAGMFIDGVRANGAIDASYHGTPINLRRIATDTRLHVTSFYGALDKVVQEESGRVLQEILGDRYTHIVHAKGAHVSYVMLPHQWHTGLPHGLEPNPIDVILKP
jgi:hypothetical protein